MRVNVQLVWFAAVGGLGLLFGLIGDRRPFGSGLLAHPLFVYVFLVAAGLIVFRTAARRPAPELIPERALVAGLVAGLALFLAGNFIAAHLLH